MRNAAAVTEEGMPLVQTTVAIALAAGWAEANEGHTFPRRDCMLKQSGFVRGWRLTDSINRGALA